MNEEIREGDTASVADASEQIESLVAERDALATERDQLRDLMMRRQADFENFRRRVERERTEFAEYAGMETVKVLLPTIDDFERALKSVPAEELSEFGKGIELIYQRLLEALKKAGLEPIETVGQQFDPHLHHAIEMVETPDAEDHTILAEFQRGYHFKGRLLRPAMVKVAVHK
jgi:molecular chaperone GrpE